MEKFLTMDELSEILRLKKSTIYKNICLGTFGLKPIKLGNRNRFRESDVEEWIAAGCPTAK